jgi:hypothetical protein
MQTTSPDSFIFNQCTHAAQPHDVRAMVLGRSLALSAIQRRSRRR